MKKEGGLAYLTAEEMAEADRSAIEEFGIDVLALMENAGLATAQLARKMLGDDVRGRRLCCLVGKGNNGGDGLVAARHLHNRGAEVTVFLACRREELRDVPARQMEIVDKMGVPIRGPADDFGKADILIDALLGYGSKGNPREPVAGMIRRANASRIAVLAVDIPSGLEATTGEPGDPCIRARATVTFAFPKTGFLSPKAREFLGELYLADISMPRRIYAGYSVGGGVFSRETVVRVW